MIPIGTQRSHALVSWLAWQRHLGIEEAVSNTVHRISRALPLQPPKTIGYLTKFVSVGAGWQRSRSIERGSNFHAKHTNGVFRRHGLPFSQERVHQYLDEYDGVSSARMMALSLRVPASESLWILAIFATDVVLRLSAAAARTIEAPCSDNSRRRAMSASLQLLLVMRFGILSSSRRILTRGAECGLSGRRLKVERILLTALFGPRLCCPDEV